jgi:glycine/D-amino acid oxidase-like deaminating enzyme
LKTTVFWRETEPVTPGPPLRGDVSCDVCIVGGGYTGLWTAYLLKQAQPTLDIHVLEAEYAGAGASGHNDGFVTPTIGHGLHGCVHQFGPRRAADAYAAVGRSIMEISRFCTKNNVHAELERTDLLLVATSPGQERRLRDDLSIAASLGGRNLPRILRDAEAREVIGSAAIRAALPGGGALVNPHKLARGLARVVVEHHAVIHERTRVHGIERLGGRYRVRTGQGMVQAGTVVIATNAYQHVFRPFKPRLLPVWSYAVVTEPLTSRQLGRVHWPNREGFIEGRNFIRFGRLTADNRVLFGGGRAAYRYGRNMHQRFIRDRRVEASLISAFHGYFPEWKDVPISHSYGGCIAITRDLVPHAGRLPDGTYYAYGYCGNGIAMSHTAGKILRDLILQRDSEYTRLPLVNRREGRFLPEPLSWLAAQTATAVLATQDRYPRALPWRFI